MKIESVGNKHDIIIFQMADICREFHGVYVKSPTKSIIWHDVYTTSHFMIQKRPVFTFANLFLMSNVTIIEVIQHTFIVIRK